MSSLGDLAALATTSLSFGIDRILSKTLGEAGPAQRPAAVDVGTRGGGETPKDGRARDEGHGTDAPVNRDDGPELVLKSQNSMRTWTHGSDERKSEGSTPGEDDVSVPESWNRRLVTDSNSENARGTRRCADKFSDTTLSRVSPKTMEFCSHLKSEHFTTTPTYPLSHYAYIRCVGDQDVEGRLSGYGVDWLGPCLMSPGVDSCCSLHAGGAASRPPLLRAAGPQPCPQRVTPVRKLHFPASSLSPWTRQPPSWIDVRRERVSLVLRGPLFEKSQAKRKKPRTSFTRVQIVELEKRFHRQKYLSSAERSSVAKTLKMTDGQVKTWFQNRRTKWRRQTAEERDAEREAASRLILSLQTDKSQCLDVTDSVCLRNSSLHALQNLRPWKDEGKTGESDTEPQAVERGGKDRRE